ncbi:MAG: hypothetical protein CVV25_13945 [Ignavibacteriae bacterium HGW-Ignavibacteriae-4]|jgi:opacity protein-like surface antigen|nr:MAG: hypothetical protein CVV25_13945 [Ignavibacteriae bacterium HGW-Ignavibacteriae-4]
MKKLFVIISVALLSISYNAKSEMDLGGMLGANFASVDLESSENIQSENRSAIAIGLFTNFHANDFLSLQITPMYIQKGGHGDNLKFSDFTADYFEIPVLARGNFDLGLLNPYVLLGPSLGFQLNSTVTSDGVELSDKLSSMDFSLQFGAGLELELEGLSLFGQFTYAYGMTDLNGDGNIEFIDKLYTRGIAIFAGVSVPLGKD